MLKLSKTQMKRYDYGDYDVYIDDVGSYWEAWLCRKNYGIAEYMFGWLKQQHPYDVPDGEYYTKEMFLELVEGNLPGYIEQYNEDHPKED